jgi:RNA polymerase sigma-70 factor (ECF subfamily)
MSVSLIQASDLSLRLPRLFAELLRAALDAADRSSQGDSFCKSQTAEVDLEDVRGSRRGDPQAYRRLVERHQKHVARIMWRFSRNTQLHEELVQDVFVEAYLSLNGYRGDSPFAHWLARIATRVGYRYWKRQSRLENNRTFSLEQWPRVATQAESLRDAGEAGVLVHNLLAALPPRDRLVLTLRYLEGCSVAETAQRTGWTGTLVKVQTLRARKKLKKLLESANRGEA